MSLQRRACPSHCRMPARLKVELALKEPFIDLMPVPYSIGDQLLTANLSKVHVCTPPVLSQDRRADASKQGALASPHRPGTGLASVTCQTRCFV